MCRFINSKISKVIVSLSFITGLLLLSVFLNYAYAQTQENDNQSRINSALVDLSAIYGSEVKTAQEAKQICGLEKYLTQCAEIGKKNNLFSTSELKEVDSLLEEIRGGIADKLSTCTNLECLMDVANELAEKIGEKNPQLATQYDLTSTIVAEKRGIVEAAKEVGVSIDDCVAMNPDTAPVDLLRACARLSKDTRVQKYVPEKTKQQYEAFDDEATIKLRGALAAGTYSCGDNTPRGCGDFCLSPSANARTQGLSAIPPVCRQIAQDIFGEGGNQALEGAYQKVGQAVDFYYKKAENTLFTTQDGRTLTKLNEIGKYLENEGRSGNVEAVSKGMDFMIAQGFATATDKDFALKMVSQFRERGGVDFDACGSNPRSCYDYIYDDFRGNFDAMDRVFEILESEIGFDPQLCEKEGDFDDNIGQQCLEGAKRALPLLETLATQDPEVGFFVAEIKGHIAEGDDRGRRREEFRGGVFVGPGGCDSEQRCANYCSLPKNGPECIAFGIKNEYKGFEGEKGVRRFQEYDYNIKRPEIDRSFEYSNYPEPYGPPIVSDPFFVGDPSSYPGYDPGPFYPQGPGPGYPPGPRPNDRCFAAIQAGDFERAKDICNRDFPEGPDQSTYNGPGYVFLEMPRDRQNDDGSTYVVAVGDPEGVKSFSVNGKGGSNVYVGKSSCQREIFSDLKKIDKSAFPLSWKIEDCNGVKSSGSAFRPFTDEPPGIFCPQDVKVCPDGVTTVGRSGPNCNFYCPYNTCPFSVESAYPAPCENPYERREIIKDEFGCTSFGQCISSDRPTFTPITTKPVSTSGGDGYPRTLSDGYKATSRYDTADHCFNVIFNGNGSLGGITNECNQVGVYDNNSSPPDSACPSGHHPDVDGGGIFYCLNDIDNYNGTCYELHTKRPQRCNEPGIGAGNCSSGYHFHTKGGFCMNNFEDPSRDCYDGSGQNKISCLPLPKHSLNVHKISSDRCPTDIGYFWDPAILDCKYDPSSTPTPRSTDVVLPPGGFCNYNNVCDAGEDSYSCSPDCGYQPPGGVSGGCFYPDATVNGAPVGGTVWCESDYVNCHFGDPSGITLDPSTLSLGAPSSCEDGGYTPPGGGGSCPSGYHYHGESGGFCINDPDDYSGICYDSTGTTLITCPQSTSNCGTGYYWDTALGYCAPSSGSGGACPSGFHNHNENGYNFCMNDREDYNGTCYDANGANVIKCPSSIYPTYSPTPDPYISVVATPPPPGCSSYNSQSTCDAVSGCYWNLPAGSGYGSCGGTVVTSTPVPTYSPQPSYTPPTGETCNYNGVCDNGETTYSCGADCGTNQYGSCSNYNDQTSCESETNCHWFSDAYSSYCYYDSGTSSACNYNGTCDSGESSGSCYADCGGTGSPTTGSCPSGYHYHGDSGGYCINDQENFSGTCYDSYGTITITCPSGDSTYTPPYTTSCNYNNICDGSETYASCPGDCYSGSSYSCNYNNVCDAGEDVNNCSADCGGGSTTACNYNNVCDAGESAGSCASDCGGYTAETCGNNYCGSGEDVNSCPSDCGGGSTTETCGNGFCGSSESSSSCPADCGSSTPTYTPYPTSDPSVDCGTSGGTWDGSACTYPTPTYDDPATECATSGGTWDSSATPPCQFVKLYNHVMIAHCAQIDRVWDGNYCRANGTFARTFGGVGKLFGLITRALGF